MLAEMALADYYRVLGLRAGATYGDVKLAYRHLARLYHPDINPGDQRAKEKFIQVTQAYRAILSMLPQESRAYKCSNSAATADTSVSPPTSCIPSKARTADIPSQRTQQVRDDFKVYQPPGVTEEDYKLKLTSFHQLRGLFKDRRFPRAVALVEGLIHRFPEDPEVRQWYAITYYRWGHDLLNSGNASKAKACLIKALRVDSQNKSLRQALNDDFKRLNDLTQAQASRSSQQVSEVAHSA